MGKDKNPYKKFLKKQKLARGLGHTTKSSRKPGGASFGDRWAPPKLSEDEDPESVILFPGEYSMPVVVNKDGDIMNMERQYYMGGEHYFKTSGKGRGCTCSAGLKLEAQGDGTMEIEVGDADCVPCYHVNDGVGGLSKRLMHVFNGVLMGNFHLVDSDRTDDDGKAYKDWVRCDGKRCKHCNSGAKKIYGRRVYWQMGKRFINSLLLHSKTVLSKHCKCGGELELAGFQCESCGEIIRDLEDDPADKAEIKVLRTKDAKCPNCREKDIPEEIYECDSCNKPSALELWDVVLHLGREGEGTESQLKIADWKPLSEDMREKLKDRMKAYDFAERLFKIPDHKFQSKRLGLPNPFGDGDSKGKVDYD